MVVSSHYNSGSHLNLYQDEGPPGNTAARVPSPLHNDSGFKCCIPLPIFHRNNMNPALISSSGNTDHTMLPIWGRPEDQGTGQMGKQFWWEQQEGHGPYRDPELGSAAGSEQEGVCLVLGSQKSLPFFP